MGAIISRFRKRPSTKDVLEKLQAQVAELESSKRDTMAWHKKLIGWMLAYFSLLYFVAAGVAYFKFFHHPLWQDLYSQALLWVPFLVAPFVFLSIRRLLTWWYHRKIRKDEDKLKELLNERKRILNEVMDKETYTVAREILEKYAPEQLMPRSSTLSTMSMSRASSSSSSGIAGRGAIGMDVRRRVTAPAAAGAGGGGQVMSSGAGRGYGNRPGVTNLGRTSPQMPTTSMAIAGGPRGSAATPMTSQRPQPFGNTQRPAPQPFGRENRGPVPGPPLPRPIMPRERGYMDRMVEYLVGDGPSNRYALICKQCQSHNGMALREEFEYISYRCCYCYFWNPARKQRPVAPRLPASPVKKRHSSSESSEDETDRPAKSPQKLSPAKTITPASPKVENPEVVSIAPPIQPLADTEKPQGVPGESEKLEPEEEQAAAEETVFVEEPLDDKDGENEEVKEEEAEPEKQGETTAGVEEHELELGEKEEEPVEEDAGQETPDGKDSLEKEANEEREAEVVEECVKEQDSKLDEKGPTEDIDPAEWRVEDLDLVGPVADATSKSPEVEEAPEAVVED